MESSIRARLLLSVKQSQTSRGDKMNEAPRFCIIAKGKTLCKCSNLDKDDNCKLQNGKYSSYSAQYCGCPLKKRKIP